MLSWPDGRRAHEACLDDSIESERALANNPFEIDRAARAAKMTLEGFKLLPSWERLRLIRETQNTLLSDRRGAGSLEQIVSQRQQHLPDAGNPRRISGN
jgi:hypothetical protein